ASHLIEPALLGRAAEIDAGFLLIHLVTWNYPPRKHHIVRDRIDKTAEIGGKVKVVFHQIEGCIPPVVLLFLPPVAMKRIASCFSIIGGVYVAKTVDQAFVHRK